MYYIKKPLKNKILSQEKTLSNNWKEFLVLRIIRFEAIWNLHSIIPKFFCFFWSGIFLFFLSFLLNFFLSFFLLCRCFFRRYTFLFCSLRSNCFWYRRSFWKGFYACCFSSNFWNWIWVKASFEPVWYIYCNWFYYRSLRERRNISHRSL